MIEPLAGGKPAMSNVQETIKPSPSKDLDSLIEQVRRFGLRHGDLRYLLKVAACLLREDVGVSKSDKESSSSGPCVVVKQKDSNP